MSLRRRTSSRWIRASTARAGDSQTHILFVNPTFPNKVACWERRYLIDFGREFQGGLRLEVSGGSPGATVSIDAGESLSQQHNRTYTGPVTQHVGSDWGYSFTWTLREGDQTIEQHEYMEFRYVSLG